MTTDDKIRDEKLHEDIHREAAKISAISSGKIDKYKYHTGEEILPSKQRQIIEQAKFANSPLGKPLKKQIEKQVGDLKSPDLFHKKDELKQIQGIFLQNLMINLVHAKLKEIINLQDTIKTDDLHYK